MATKQFPSHEKFSFIRYPARMVENWWQHHYLMHEESAPTARAWHQQSSAGWLPLSQGSSEPGVAQQKVGKGKAGTKGLTAGTESLKSDTNGPMAITGCSIADTESPTAGTGSPTAGSSNPRGQGMG